ncbi:Sap-like sulfolipid-1-addressing protein [Natrinema hispanicum]|uniref:Sap-like sulfolipid-1-addressing protein n=1 Tax=Natrinema hispanicum TaxID=392421 RepID=A0A482YGH7_9EURY|nr:GAP family protein [Natrinema hispanicum]RZV12119.1 Sap-like sulfolipid-1-addressing protein [Natrinema hispanicum]
MRFLEVLPMVFVMIAGPQILSAIFLATSRNWRRNSAAFVGGAAISISLVVAVAYEVSAGVTEQGPSNTTLSAIVLVALVLAMVHTYLTRETSEPPRWMGKLETATPRFSFRLGFLLMGFFPTDILTSVAVGSYLAASDASLLDAIPFILCTLLVLALPSLTLVVFSERAETFLPKARNWMDANSWIVNELVILLFIAMSLNNLLG